MNLGLFFRQDPPSAAPAGGLVVSELLEHNVNVQSVFVVSLGVLGVVVSWAYFVPSTLTYGFVESWVAAFNSHPFSVGLHWDLVFTDLIVFAIAVFDRERLGTRVVIATIAMGCTLGVCAALPVYWLGLQRARARAQQEPGEDSRP